MWSVEHSKLRFKSLHVSKGVQDEKQDLENLGMIKKKTTYNIEYYVKVKTLEEQRYIINWWRKVSSNGVKVKS